MKWLWHLHREWSLRAMRARDEVERSRAGLEETRRKAVPLVRWRESNHFAQLISDSLSNGGNGR